jgi:aquaporin Z
MNGTVKKYLAELIGTATLVLVGCGAVTIGGYGAALGGGNVIAVLPIALAFGLAVTAMAYAIGPVSGCHINPAVTVAMVAAGRMGVGEAIGYIVSQIVGGIVGALVLIVILSGKGGAAYDIAKAGLGQNGWGEGYLGGYGIGAAIIVEIVATFLFTAVILGVTHHSQSAAGHPAGLIIGLTLFVLHLPFIQVTGLSVNPARSLGPAIFVNNGVALGQVWLFLIMPLVGGAIAGWLFRANILSAHLPRFSWGRGLSCRPRDRGRPACRSGGRRLYTRPPFNRGLTDGR